MLIRYVTLRPWPMTRWPWKFVVHQASRDQSLHEIWAKSSNSGWIIDNFVNFSTRYFTLWTSRLTSWPWTFYTNSGVMRLNSVHSWSEIELSRLISTDHRWVIDNLARFRRAIIGLGHFFPTVLRDAWTQLHQTWRGHRAINSTAEAFSAFGYLAVFSNASSSNLRDVENDAKFRTFWPPWKFGEEWATSLYKLLKFYLRSNLRNIFDGRPLGGCWAR